MTMSLSVTPDVSALSAGGVILRSPSLTLIALL
jgi:hypothetical protein